MADVATEQPHLRVLVGCTGSVAAIKTAEISRRLVDAGASVRVVTTRCGLHFLRSPAAIAQRSHSPLDEPFAPSDPSLQELYDRAKAPSKEVLERRTEELKELVTEPGQVTSAEARELGFAEGIGVYVDADEWGWQSRGDDVLHISLRKWADAFVIAPLDANSLAKIATGICDNLLTSVARAWDYNKPLIVAPAMNTFMWSHPITRPQLNTLEQFGATVVSPISKRLECGDSGQGALASPAQIVEATLSKLVGAQKTGDDPLSS